jgi:hypothetical protein
MLDSVHRGAFICLMSTTVMMVFSCCCFFPGLKQSQLCYFEIYQRQTAQEPIIVEGLSFLAAMSVCVGCKRQDGPSNRFSARQAEMKTQCYHHN